MASKAKKLPSGKYRSRASYKGNDGKYHTQSFTATTKKEAERLAADFELSTALSADSSRWTLGEAIDNYITLKEPLLSPATTAGYRKIRRMSFQPIMNVPLKRITTEMLQKAVVAEMERPKYSRAKNKKLIEVKTQAPKSVKNAYGLVSATLGRYLPDKAFRVDLPKVPRKIRTLPDAASILNAVKGSRIELACTLAVWLSFSESEIRGLTKSKSLDVEKDGETYITIREVVIYSGAREVRKELAKNDKRTRRHKLPKHIKEMIDKVEGDIIVPLTPRQLLHTLQSKLKENSLPQITFHDLRHVNASVMALLKVPDVYAQERGGWATDHIMKTVYTETFTTERQNVDNIIDKYFNEIVGRQ